MKKLTVYDFLRAGHVKRWHIINTVNQQTVAEHSFLVAIIAMELYNEMVGVDPNDDNSIKEFNALVMGAIFHDIAEIKLGDLPTPSKQLFKQFYGDDMFDKIEETIFPEMPYTGHGELGTELRKIIKMADTIEAVHWIYENGVGAHAKVVADKSWDLLADRVREYSMGGGGDDWYTSVNKILMALGMPYINRDHAVSPP